MEKCLYEKIKIILSNQFKCVAVIFTFYHSKKLFYFKPYVYQKYILVTMNKVSRRHTRYNPIKKLNINLNELSGFQITVTLSDGLFFALFYSAV